MKKAFFRDAYAVFTSTKKLMAAVFASVFILLLFPLCAYADLLTLPEGLKLAAEKSSLLKMAQSEEMIAEADTTIARSKQLPEVNALFSRTSLRYQPAAVFGTVSVPVSEKDFLAYSLSIQQTLFDFGGNASKYNASMAVLDVKRLDTKRMRNLVAVNFVIAYLDLLESEKMLVVADKEVQRLESHNLVARHLYDAGVITKNDMLQAAVRISDAKQRLLTAGNLRKVNASRLNSLLQRPLLEDLRVMDINGLSVDLSGINMANAWEVAERSRAELLMVEETMKALELEEKARTSEYLPLLFLRGGYDYTENRFQVHEENWSLTLGVRINLFRGGSTRGELLKLQGQKQKLHEQKNMIIDEIRLEVQKYMLAVSTAGERLEVSRNAVAQAEENLRINEVKYREGAGTATDVLDAVTLFTIAETNYHKSIYDLRRSEAAVLYATGKDLLEVYK